MEIREGLCKWCEVMNPLWKSLTDHAGVNLSDEQAQQMSRYLDLLFEANQKMNLTRITDRSAAEIQHVGDSLTLLPYFPQEEFSLADIGSGGGVPGIPLAIARPEARIMLVESTKKKADFLTRTITVLGLGNVRVVAQRAEDAGNSGLRQSFDVVTARAVATIDWLAEWTLPLVKVGGKALLMKGPRHAEELPVAAKAIKLLGGGPAVVHPVELPGATGLVIVEIPKIGKTDKRYPRPATSAKGNPIG
jgi:16S rRNA (guanine527-N7)-methyltransferase